VASPLLQRSKTHAVAGSEATRGRTSLTCHLAKSHEPCPGILRKIQALTNKPLDHMELPQVARYTDGQRYVEHYDGVDPEVRRLPAAVHARAHSSRTPVADGSEPAWKA
jgi:prolyl 4-hydroxylase